MGLEAESRGWRTEEEEKKEEEKEEKKEEKKEEEEEEEKKKEENFLLCESIGHRPLWGRCPKTVKNNIFISVKC